MNIVHKLSEFFKKLWRIISGDRDDNLYSLKSQLKIYLIVIGLLIMSASSIYTYSLVERLKEQELGQMEVYKEGMMLSGLEGMDNEAIPQSVKDFILTLPNRNDNIPVIVTDYAYDVQFSRNINGLEEELTTPEQKERGRKILDSWIRKGVKPIEMRDDIGIIRSKVYSNDSNNLTLLKYYPVFQFALILFFIGFGYLIFSATRRSEQNQVWVGMAKETAHQLGTPIAAIMGWIEHLKTNHEGDEMTQEVVKELENDVTRLSLVADRFSKIGSAPELIEKNMYEELDSCRDYMQKRAPRRVTFDFPKIETPPQYLAVKINAHLFDWVVENLLRNALDAMEGGIGKISAKIYEETNWVCIDISDTGKGIPKAKFQAVFQPGFTTKKRGWGLGLSLAKRIIEDYHGGKIFVKDSETGKFTTFTIKLPKNVG